MVQQYYQANKVSDDSDSEQQMLANLGQEMGLVQAEQA